MKRIISQLSVDARLLYERLINSNVGDEITYAELSGIIQRNVQKEAYGVLMTARRMARRYGKVEDDKQVNMEFGTIINSGLKRLDDCEIIGSGERVVRHVRKQSRTAVRILSNVKNFDGLPNNMKIKHNTMVSVFNVIASAIRPNRLKKIEGCVEQSGKLLSYSETLEAFKKQ